MSTASLPPDYFEGMFAADGDPWRFDSSDYEAAKYAHTLSVLQDRRFAHGFEVGCANGALTRRLAGVCDRLLAVDVSPTALAAARRRTRDLPGVRLDQMRFPVETPGTDRFDLVVLSEVAYYWSDRDLERAAAWLAGGVDSGGELLLVHWTGETDYPQTGDGAVSSLKRALTGAVDVRLTIRCPRYRLDLWRRR